MTGTFDLLVNNCNPQSTLHFPSQDGGIAFIQEGDEHQVLPHGGGRSGQSGGCGAGCSCMGPGQGRSATVQVQNNNNETHFNEEEGDSTSDNLEGTVNLYSSPDRAHVLLFNIPCDMATTWLLMDSCLSVNIITNRKWLHNIHKVIHPMTVYCNAGQVLLTHMGYSGSYPEPVWYNPSGIANIMPLHNVSQYS